jgi:hypothetical protein
MLPKELLNIIKNNLEGANSGLPLATADDLARVSYGLAYIVLPDMVHHSFDGFLRHWRDRFPFGFMLCDFGCSKEKVRTTIEQKAAFKTQEAPLSPTCDCYLVEFPTPPPVSRLSEAEFRAVIAAGRKAPLLAPYFAAAVHDRVSGRRYYFVLGQSPSGGTTFRTVTADGTNCNLGPGPEPDLASFFVHIAEAPGN